MAKQVDIDQLERDMGDASSDWRTVHHDELANLIQRVREGEAYRLKVREVVEQFCSL